LSNALDYAAFLRASGMTNDDEYASNFYYMGEPTCVLLCFEDERYPSGLWGAYNSPIDEFEGMPLDEDLKEFSRANVRICSGECGCPNWPRGGSQTVFGKRFDSVCSSVITYHNPDAESLPKMKRMMEYWMRHIAASKEMGME
jgi:hypothetical protein